MVRWKRWICLSRIAGGKFLRVKVRIDLNRPLTPYVYLKRMKEGIKRIDVKYERLPIFCYECGLLGHDSKRCDQRSLSLLRRACHCGNLVLGYEQKPMVTLIRRLMPAFSMQSEFFHDAEAIGEPALPSMNRTSLKKAAKNKLLRQSELQPYFKPGTSDAFKLKKMLKRVPGSDPSQPHSSS